MLVCPLALTRLPFFFISFLRWSIGPSLYSLLLLLSYISLPALFIYIAYNPSASIIVVFVLSPLLPWFLSV
ncbi:hypothetical protein F5H01DRAFT_352497, partial [Linnemannia elongata]